MNPGVYSTYFCVGSYRCYFVPYPFSATYDIITADCFKYDEAVRVGTTLNVNLMGTHIEVVRIGDTNAFSVTVRNVPIEEVVKWLV